MEKPALQFEAQCCEKINSIAAACAVLHKNNFQMIFFFTNYKSDLYDKSPAHKT